jgi:hypothetical protein
MWLSGAERCARSHGIVSWCCCPSCRKIKSVEFMACDALALAAGPLGLREAICKDADLQVNTCWHGYAVYARVTCWHAEAARGNLTSRGMQRMQMSARCMHSLPAFPAGQQHDCRAAPVQCMCMCACVFVIMSVDSVHVHIHGASRSGFAGVLVVLQRYINQGHQPSSRTLCMCVHLWVLWTCTAPDPVLVSVCWLSCRHTSTWTTASCSG